MLGRPIPCRCNCFASATSGRPIPTEMNLFATIPPQMLGLSHLECTENIHVLMEFTIFGFSVKEIGSTRFTWFPITSICYNPMILNPIAAIGSEHQVKIKDKGELVERGFVCFRLMTKVAKNVKLPFTWRTFHRMKCQSPHSILWHNQTLNMDQWPGAHFSWATSVYHFPS